jgi:predicted dehydrogenase
VTRALIIGAGSIGVRHARVLRMLGLDVGFVTSRSDVTGPTFDRVSTGIRDFAPSYVVVANPTGSHSDAVTELVDVGYRGRLLVEKPAALTSSTVRFDGFKRLGFGFNLRFHPVIERLRQLLVGTTIYTVEAYAGQHLDSWRPARPVNEQYSSSLAQGGGVLRDLSHELDYLALLLGRCSGIFARGGKLGDVTVDSDDAWALVARYESAPVVSLQLNYLDTQGRRRIVVNSSVGTIEADLIASTIRHDQAMESFPTDPDFTYTELHRAMFDDSDARVASLDDADATDRTIEMVEASAAAQRWMEW